jgi:membrane protein
VGSDTASQLEQIIKNASLVGKSKIAAIMGASLCYWVLLPVFAEIQDSINSIMGAQAKPKKGWLKLIQNRFLSFSVIISLGFCCWFHSGFPT